MGLWRAQLVALLGTGLLMGLGASARAQTADSTAAFPASAQRGTLTSSPAAGEAVLAVVADAVSREVGVLTDQVGVQGDAASREVVILVNAPVSTILSASSREVSLLTDPEALLPREASSRELSVLVDPPLTVQLDAASREISMLVDPIAQGVKDVASREWSVYADPSLAPPKEAASREVSALVDDVGQVAKDVIAREVAILQDAPVVPLDATTREVAVLADLPTAGAVDCISREVAALVQTFSALTNDAASREVGILTTSNMAIADASSRELGVLMTEFSTPTLLSMLTVSPTEAGLVVRWQFGANPTARTTTLERAQAVQGEFEAVAAEASEENGVLTVLDRDVEAGKDYWYRLVVANTDGSRQTFGPVSASAELKVVTLALSPIAPTPSRGPIQLRFEVPDESRVKISVFDVAGRELVVISDQSYRPGRYSVAWDLVTRRGPAAGGVYFVRLQSAGRSLTRRLVIAR